MKCCFCGAELIDEGLELGNENRTFCCHNLDCNHYDETMNIEIWQALIDGKNARDALKVADDKVKIAKTALSDIKNICERGQTLTYHEKAAIWADAHSALNAMAITSITK